ncbi:MAG: hypothetical protein U0271_47095 [Polyangiaceae bacterium]
MNEPAPAELPVVEFESLHVSGERLALLETGFVPATRLARLGDDDAVLVYVGPDRKLWSRHLRKAFSAWPPELGDAVSHPFGGINMNPTDLVGRADGSFSVNTSAGSIFATVDEPGVRCALSEPGFFDSKGVYTFNNVSGSRRLVYRVSREEVSHVLDLGDWPSRAPANVGCVTEGGRLMLPVWRDEQLLQVLVAKDGKLEGGAQVAVTRPFRAWAIARPGGGSYLALDRRATVDVHTVAEDGRIVGAPWIQRNVSETDHVAAFTRWRDGFALCVTRDKTGYAVSVSDGVRTTFGRGTIREDLPLFDLMGLVSSPDGRVLLFVGPSPSGPVLLRLLCRADAHAAFTPERIAPVMVSAAPSQHPLAVRETVLQNLRQRALLGAFASLCHHQPYDYEGDDRVGRYYGSNEQGADFVVHWDATGLVALGFSKHNRESEADLEEEDRRPGKYLVGLPAEMRPLALRAIAFGRRLATEGLWISASGTAGRAGELEVLGQLSRFDPGDVWLGGGAELSALAGRIAPLSYYSLTREEQALLFNSATRDDGELELGRVKEVVADLARLGVDWPDAVAQARALCSVELPPAPTPSADFTDLPVVPALDTTSSRAEVTALIERAAQALPNDIVAALDALLAAWRLNRHPRLADLVEKLALRARAHHGKHDVAATERALRAALDSLPDPTMTRPTLEWLWQAWPTGGGESSPLEDTAAKVLIHNRDCRFVESLEQRCELGRPRSSKPAGAMLRSALTALKEVVPGPLDEVDIQCIGAMEDALAGRSKRSNGITTRDLFVAVHENPEDDTPRRDLAERLTEAGDPRGEFISLQLARKASGGEPTAREVELLAAHGRSWMGEIEPVLGATFTFERGFLASATTKEERGGTRAHSPPILATGGGTQWEWSTIRRLDLWPHAYEGTFGLLRGSRIRGVLELARVSQRDLADLLYGPPRKLERLEIEHRQTEHYVCRLERYLDELPEKLPNLRSLALAAPRGDLQLLRPMLARLSRLRELSVRLAQPSLDELAAAGCELGLEVVTSLGRINFMRSLPDKTLTITFPYVFDETYSRRIAASLDAIVRAPARRSAPEGGPSSRASLDALDRAPARRSAPEGGPSSRASLDALHSPLTQIVLVAPPGARVVRAESSAATLERDWDSMPLEPILRAAERLGVAFELVAGPTEL